MTTVEELQDRLIFQSGKAESLEKDLIQAKMLIEKLNADLEKTKDTSASTHKTVFIAREKKLAKLCGRPVSINDPEINEWIQDASQHLKTIDSVDAQLDFLYDNLGGQCKDEIRLRSESERNTPAKIFTIIRTVFTTHQTLASLQQQFYQRNQEPGETLQKYSLALMKLVDKIELKDSKAITDKDTMLKEKFVDGIQDDGLRREMRKSLQENKSLKFPKFRETVLVWAEDNRTKLFQVKSEHINADFEKSIKETIIEMKKQIENQGRQLQTVIEKLKTGNRPQLQQKPVKYEHLTCFKCKGKGHKANKCPSVLAGTYKKEMEEMKQGE